MQIVVKTFYSEMIIGTYILQQIRNQRHQNHQSLLKPIFTVLSETQHACECPLPTSC